MFSLKEFIFQLHQTLNISFSDQTNEDSQQIVIISITVWKFVYDSL